MATSEGEDARQVAYSVRYGEPVDTYTWNRVVDTVLKALADAGFVITKAEGVSACPEHPDMEQRTAAEQAAPRVDPRARVTATLRLKDWRRIRDSLTLIDSGVPNVNEDLVEKITELLQEGGYE